ncbi:MAG: disulfide bond formation protein B [Acetobacter fabarum]|jgi:disulfide bond formation protein DsbB|uniref:disulfide bond formation protein B n=1 Tax=Acetobacter fabarum TaxID=483199 RepID=UPI00242B4017|nr:disulfide bond formation protein B [Acetobacter fabarum]MCH4025687.1 disulfide bond formation protein B [Acetobacter fabarum]MCH4054661.1 disulfide bond formation protein B [Acetobacter fabarum]MCH4086454.1 disulfide bond formation protein B [Acetobacter fabarum]MCH4128498.1 disulfide bond formation protein B [Acetobacter fabarum]MCH4138329.1 disulfide bond formation protein B [Acetobacter fabarum]
MKKTMRLSTVALFMILAGFAALGVAWWTQHRLGIMPCELCLWERWPWRVLIVLGVVAPVLPARMGRGALWACVPVLLAAEGLAICHAGVEWKWWPSPFPACHAAHVVGRTLAERWASMPLVPSKPCDAPTYLIPGLPVSMAVMGAVFVLVVLAGLCVGMGRIKKSNWI